MKGKVPDPRSQMDVKRTHVGESEQNKTEQIRKRERKGTVTTAEEETTDESVDCTFCR